MIYAMSDIHGQYELFRNLMEQIPLEKMIHSMYWVT